MSDLSRRAIFRALPAAATVAIAPVAAAAGPLADASIIALAARVVALAEESDAAEADLVARDERLTAQEPPRPSTLGDGRPYQAENATTDQLRKWVAELSPDEIVYRSYAGRLARSEAWDAEVATLADRLGIPAALERSNGINGELIPSVVRLAETAPATIAGIAAKAQAVHAIASWDGAGEMKELSASILADVRRLAGRLTA